MSLGPPRGYTAWESAPSCCRLTAPRRSLSAPVDTVDTVGSAGHASPAPGWHSGPVRALTYAAFGARLGHRRPGPGRTPGGRWSGSRRAGWSQRLARLARPRHRHRRLPHIPAMSSPARWSRSATGRPRLVGRRVTAPSSSPAARARCAGWGRPGLPAPAPARVQRSGSFAERVVVHAAGDQPVAPPDDVTTAQAAGLGCRVATAYRAVTVRADVQAGESVVVLGCGGVGCPRWRLRSPAVPTSSPSTCRPTPCGGHRPRRPSRAAPGDDLPERVHDLTGGGAHVSIDALGSLRDGARGRSASGAAADTSRSGCCRPAPGPPDPHGPGHRVGARRPGSHGMTRGLPRAARRRAGWSHPAGLRCSTVADPGARSRGQGAARHGVSVLAGHRPVDPTC